MEYREGLEWEVIFYLGEPEIDDSIEDHSQVKRVVEAPDFETAVRYAEQYMRKMKLEEDTAEKWANAEILSVVMR